MKSIVLIILFFSSFAMATVRIGQYAIYEKALFINGVSHSFVREEIKVIELYPSEDFFILQVLRTENSGNVEELFYSKTLSDYLFGEEENQRQIENCDKQFEGRLDDVTLKSGQKVKTCFSTLFGDLGEKIRQGVSQVPFFMVDVHSVLEVPGEKTAVFQKLIEYGNGD